MWVYEKRLQYPVNITQTNAKLAQVIISQFGGPDGELAASQRYLSQRYTMPDGMTKGLLNDIGTEELAHLEIVCAIIYQLTKNLSVEEIKASGFDKYYVDHTLGIWPQAAGGIPFNACVFQVKGDPITDLTEDLAAEQKVRSQLHPCDQQQTWRFLQSARPCHLNGTNMPSDRLLPQHQHTSYRSAFWYP